MWRTSLCSPTRYGSTTSEWAHALDNVMRAMQCLATDVFKAHRGCTLLHVPCAWQRGFSAPTELYLTAA